MAKMHPRFALALASVLASIPLTPFAQAGSTQIPIVGNYELSKQSSIFKQESRFEVPEVLLQKMTIETPSRAYMEGYPDVFFQNERMVVCNVDCDQPQNVAPVLDSNGNFKLNLRSESRASKANRNLDNSLIRQATVYYWVDKVLRRFESMGHEFKHRLVVRVDRKVSDPTIGTRMDNNAFFVDADLDTSNWSLNFLPAKNSLLVRMSLGTVVASAYDPSVAMHEATHFLFQEMMGDIINPEIMGLHEAFADYFALTTIGSSDIGRVMVSGKAIRSAAEILQYSPGMEVHDLGNVVLSGLWNIRNLIENKDLADQVAFETIRDLSTNPYTAAGDVTAAHRRAMEKIAPALASNPELTGKTAEIWSKTKLQSSESDESYLSVIEAPFTEQERKSFFTMAISTEVSPDIVKEWGTIQKQTFTLTQGPVRVVPMTDAQRVVAQAEAVERRQAALANGETPVEEKPVENVYEWRFIAIQDLNGENKANAGRAVATPFWVLKDLRTGSTLGAYSLSGERVSAENSESYRNFLALSENIGQVEEYGKDFGADVAALLKGESWSQMKARRVVAYRDRFFQYGYSGKIVHMTEYQVRTQPTFMGWVLGLIGEDTAKAFKRVNLFGVAPSDLPVLAEDGRLPKLPDGNLLVGYEIESRTGFKLSGRLISVGEE